MMRPLLVVATTALLTLTAWASSAQPPSDPLTALQIAVACAPPPAASGPSAGSLRLIGAQDTVPRSLFSGRDLLVINGGTAQGVQLGQQYFVRRTISFGTAYRGPSHHGVHTAGWIRVVAVNDTTAIATVEHTCGAALQGDYLEPFVAPQVPEGADRVDTSGELDFAALGRILFGDDERRTGGSGEFMLIDRGADQGVSTGARFAIYRNVGVDGLPLASIGEGVVVATSPAQAVMRINRARDAVQSGDYVVPRKK